MSSVLTSFLVGIGWDTSSFDQGTKHIESSMGSVKSSVLQTAASIGTLTALTGAGLKFAKSTSEIDNFTRSIGVGRSDLLAFGGALQGMGGDADSAIGILTSLEQKRASILTGETGWIAPAARAGIDTNSILQATDSLDAVLRLSDQFQQLSAQQRLNAADALGFDPATVAFLSQGRDVVEATLNQYRDARPLVDGLTEASRDLTQEWSRLEALAGGIGDKVQSKLIPAITQATTVVTEFLNANKQAIDAGIEKYGTPENIEAASVAAAGAGVSTAGAVAGSLLQRFGLTGTGSLVAGGARLAGGVGIAYGVADIASREINNALIGYDWYREADRWLGQATMNATGYSAVGKWDFAPEGDPRLGGMTRDSWWDFGNVYEGVSRESLYQFTAPDSAWTPGYGSGPKPQPTTINVNATLEMDGKVLADKVLSVVSDSNQAALDDLQSTTER